MTYWHRTGPRTSAPTRHVGGAWDLDTQHIAPLLGGLAHEVERDRDARRDDGLQITRISYDILGTVPLEPVDVEVAVLRAGRTIELVEARACHGGRCSGVRLVGARHDRLVRPGGRRRDHVRAP